MRGKFNNIFLLGVYGSSHLPPSRPTPTPRPPRLAIGENPTTFKPEHHLFIALLVRRGNDDDDDDDDEDDDDDDDGDDERERERERKRKRKRERERE